VIYKIVVLGSQESSSQESSPHLVILHVYEKRYKSTAGDLAWTMIDDTHVSVMSCQHSRPMGRFAAHNVVRDMLVG
jgi:hypothetical protein